MNDLPSALKKLVTRVVGKRSWREAGGSKEEDVRCNSEIPEQKPLVTIGKGTYGTPRVYHWHEGAQLTIGNYCSIADGVEVFLGGNHRSDWCTTYPFSVKWDSARKIPGHPATKGDVRIGHDVWIGQGAVILSGIKIGTGAVIGAKSVVTRDVPAYCIAAGNPAQIVRRRFSDEICGKLLASCWWELSDAHLDQLIPFLLSADVALMLEMLDKIRKEDGSPQKE